MVKIYISDGIEYDVAEHRLDEFLKDHPNATLVEAEEESVIQEDIIETPQQTIEVADSVALESTKKPVDTPEQKQPETEDVGFFEKIGDLFSAGLSNMPKSLHASLTATRAVPIDLIERLDPKLADKYAKSIMDIDQDLQIALVDNETQEEITIENNPERYKELEQLKQQGNEIDVVYAGMNGLSPGDIADEAWKKIIGTDYKQIQESREYAGDIVKGIKGAVGTEGYEQYGAADVVGGAFETVTDMLVTVGAGIMTYGTSLIPQIMAPMYADFNVEKANTLYGDSDDPLGQLTANNETDVLIPATLGVIAYRMEKFGMKGITKHIINKGYASRGAATLLMTGKREAITEYGQFGTEVINRELAKGKTLLEAGEVMIDSWNSDEALESYLRGFVGGTTIGGGANLINRGLRNGPDGTRFVNQKIRELSLLNTEKSNQKSNTVKASLDMRIAAVSSELKNYIQENDALVDRLDSKQKSTIIRLMNEKDGLYKQANALRTEVEEGKITARERGVGMRPLNIQSKEIDRQLQEIRNEVVGKQLDESLAETQTTAKTLGFEKLNTYETTKEFVEKTGRPSNIDGFIDEAGQIYINKEVAKETGTISVGQHELLHKILNNQFSDQTQVNKLVDDFKQSLPKEQMDLLEDRIKNNYDAKYLKENPDEYFTVYASLLKDGDITQDNNVLTKIKDTVILPILRKFGFAKADFESGDGIRNFIQEYSRNIDKAVETINVKKEGTRAFKGDKMSQSAADKVNTIYKDKGIQGAFEIIEEYRPMAKKIASNFRDVPGYTTNQDILVEEILTGNRGVYDLISEFNPSKEVPLAAYINKYLKSRAIESANRILDTKFTTDVTEARNVTATETAEDVVTQKETKQKVDKAKPKTLRKKLNIDQDLIKTVKAAVKKAFGTKLPDVNSKKFKEALSKMYKVELKKPIADLMGTRDTYKTFLENNWKAVYDAMPVSTLVKFERMKSPSDRVFTKVVKTNISPTEVDQAIKDRKLPFNVSRNSGPTLYEKVDVNESDFVNHFIGDDVAPSTKGTRKDALAEAIGEELAFDATPEVSQTKEVAEKTKAIRELEGKKETKEETQEQTALLGKQIDRNMEDKFSVSQKIIDLEFNPDKRIDKLLEATIGKPTYKLDNKDNIDKYILAVKDVLIPMFPKGFINKTVLRPSNRILPLKGKKEITVDGVKTTVDNYYTQQRNNLLADNDLKYGKNFTGKGKQWKARTYDKIFGETESKVNKSFKDGTVKKYNEINTSMHRQMWERIDKSIRDNNENARVIGNFLKMTGNLSDHAHRQGAELVARSINPKGVKGRAYEWEHAVPATAAYLYLLNISLEKGSFKNEYAAVMENYKLIALDKFDNDKLTDAKLSEKMPKGWKLLTNYWWQRYFNEEVAKQNGGIDTRSLIFNDGKTAFDKFKVGADGKITTLKILEAQDKAGDKNSRTFPNKLNKSSSLKQIEILKNYDEAATKGRSLKTPEKGISVFDFDDTLAKTNSKVLYTLPDGTKGRLSATEFAIKSRLLEDQGAVFDFSQFNKVVGGKKGPLADLALKRQGKFGSKDIFILTARPQQSAVAIHEFLKGIGLEIPIENITGLEDGTPQAKAAWVADKAAKGYNNFYFADDAIKNVKAVKEILDQIDVKSKVQQAKFSKSENLNKEFNIIIEKKTGLGRDKQYSPARAKTIGANKGKWNFWIPYSAEDFVGLMYPILSKGKEGDTQMAWLKKNLLDPFNRAENAITQDKIAASNDFNALKKQFTTIPKTLKKEAVDGFTYENALRVYLWDQQGETIPGLAQKDIKELTDFINKDTDLKVFANELIKIQKGKPYPAPTDTWLAGSLTTDVIGGINTANRTEYLQEWQENVDIIFSKENMNKLEATYGSRYVEALRNILTRMKKGSNKTDTGNRVVNNILDWVNNSVGAIMFLNTRSAVLQTISSINFINWSDNNVLKAGKAFANQPQYWKDFMKLFNSDFLVARRKGLKINVTESEIADAAESGSVKGVVSMLLKKGFVFTQIADSFAIASGGATFYRNRLNKLVKDGMSKAEAEKQAFLDFYDVAEESQQSSRTDRISMQQASAAGRVILAFGNTPMQYGRLMKKAFLDLKNGRGDTKSNVSKIVYYAVIQNIMFNAIQNALFVMMFDDDDDIPQDKAVRTANGMMDSILRGLGIGGAAVSTAKNIALKIAQESGKKSPKYEDAAWEMLDFSPPISSKVSKLRSAGRTVSWNQKEINEKGFSLDNPAYLAGAQVVSATTNIPLDRVIKKGNNIADAVSEESEIWQKIALLSGWSMWELGGTKKKKPTKSKSRVRR